jgi:tetrapyrrole methylase family protein/MazG family protein
MTKDHAKAFSRLYELISRLRGPGGCPWDIEQNPQSLRGDLLEETYECVEALDEKVPAHTREELGDLFLLVTMLSFMHEEAGLFSVADVLEEVSEKIIRRHPHVFSDVKVRDSAEVLENWARIKVEQEGRTPKDSLLDQVSKSLPPLERAYKLQKKAAKAGFDWSSPEGVTLKIEEELSEVTEAAEDIESVNGKGDKESETLARDRLEAELGDLLFAVVNLSRFFEVDPSTALLRTCTKFIRRFKYVEQKMKESGQALSRENLEVMDGFWEDAKQLEHTS